MTHDFATTSRSDSNTNDTPIPSYSVALKLTAIIIVTLLIVIALVLWFVLNDTDEAGTFSKPIVEEPVEQVQVEHSVDVVNAIEGSTNDKSKEDDSNYAFYDSLKNNQWSVPVQRGTYVDPNAALSREQTVYKLQAASFTNAKDANRLVVKLKGLGLKAKTVSSVSSAGQSWYQVSVGPFTNISQLNKAHDILVSMNMMPLKKRVH